jgi:hypothetical protein
MWRRGGGGFGEINFLYLKILFYLRDVTQLTVGDNLKSGEMDRNCQYDCTLTSTADCTYTLSPSTNYIGFGIICVFHLVFI